jgi:beta-glucosidase
MDLVLEANKMEVKEHGEEFIRKRFEEFAMRLLRNIFRVGLFENPYIDPAESSRIVGNLNFMNEGYEAQLYSVVMLKNSLKTFQLKKDLKV